MTPSAQSALRLVTDLAELAARLAGRNIVVASLHCDWGSFGSWTLEAQRGADADRYGHALLAGQYDTPGPEVRRVWWDGRERLVTIETAPIFPLSSPGPWTRILEQPVDDCAAAIQFAEDQLAGWS